MATGQLQPYQRPNMTLIVILLGVAFASALVMGFALFGDLLPISGQEPPVVGVINDPTDQPTATETAVPVPTINPTRTPIPTPTLPLPEEALAVRANFSGVQMPDYDMQWFFPLHPSYISMGVGRESIVMVSMGNLEIQSRDGRRTIARTRLFSIFDPVLEPGVEGYTGDPRVIYDPWLDRFFIVAHVTVYDMDCTPQDCVSWTVMAMSKTGNPRTFLRTDWNVWKVDGTDDFLPDGRVIQTPFQSDYVSLGTNGRYAVHVVNQLSAHHQHDEYAKIRVYDPIAMEQNPEAQPTVVDFTNFVVGGRVATGNIQAAMHLDRTPDDELYFIMPLIDGPVCQVAVLRVDMGENPTLEHEILDLGSRCTQPPDGLQPGEDSLLVYMRNSTLNPGKAVYQNGHLWSTFNVTRNYGSRDVSALLTVQIDVREWPEISLVQEIETGEDNVWYAMPAMVVDDDNNISIVFECFGPQMFISACFTGRLGSDPLETMRPVGILHEGQSTVTWEFQPSEEERAIFEGKMRTGPNSDAALDPLDGSAWIIAQHAVEDPISWGTWIGNLDWTVVR